MQPKHLNLQILSEQVDLHSFNCGDEDLNDFLINNAYQSMMHRMSLTYILKENEQVVAYFSLLFDKISKEDTRNTTSFIEFKSNKGLIMEGKDFKSYPSLKVGRLGVNISCQKRQVGHLILDYIKRLTLTQQLAGCRFITVDAYRTAFTFYEKNGFEYLTLKDVNDHTRLMYYDLYRLL